MSDELLRIENVTKKYGKTVANSDISFSVNAGRRLSCSGRTARANPP